jgi:hypothetical protein
MVQRQTLVCMEARSMKNRSNMVIYLLVADADGERAPRVQVWLEVHMSCCEDYRRSLDHDRETMELLQLIDDAWAPPDLRLRIRIACRRPAGTQ